MGDGKLKNDFSPYLPVSQVSDCNVDILCYTRYIVNVVYSIQQIVVSIMLALCHWIKVNGIVEKLLLVLSSSIIGV